MVKYIFVYLDLDEEKQVETIWAESMMGAVDIMESDCSVLCIISVLREGV